ncbi:MAG: pyruvate kinase [Acidaminococcaceae bacterium]
MKKTKIICTVGPSTDNVELLEQMLAAGMDIARFNFSHGNHANHAQRIAVVRLAAAKIKKPLALIADTKGPEMRLGNFAQDEVHLAPGDEFCLTTEDVIGTQAIAHVNYAGLPVEVQIGNAILLADGLLSLEVIKIAGTKIYTKVVHGGNLSSRKRVAIPGLELKLPFLSAADEEDIKFAVAQDMDYIAASFVQKAADVLAIRKVLEDLGSELGIIAKIENEAGVRNINEIINVADGVMVARGDLGVELPAEVVPLVQKEIIKQCNKAGKPVITATQMLESMITSYRATRAEASDIANSIFDGTDVIMLSGETASGQYPLEAVQTMAKIAMRTEEALDYVKIFREKGIGAQVNATDAISHATVQIAQELDANSIITITESGYTARMIAKYRPQAKVVAVSPRKDKVRRMQLYWGVYPLLGPASENTDEVIEMSVACARENKFICEGNLAVVTAGVPVGKTGSTNLIKVIKVGTKLVEGTGVGKKPVVGKVCRAITLSDFSDKFEAGDVLVVCGLENENARYAAKASAIIAEEGGFTSTAAIVGINYGIPVIVGATGALTKLTDGTEVTVDTACGIVYKGKLNIK